MDIASDKSPKRANTNLSPMEEIEVMLHEYDTLRDELVENVARQLTTLAIWTTVIVAFLAFVYQAGNLGLLTLLPIVILVFLNLEAGRQFSMLVKSTYVRMIEQQINAIAGRPILNWEHSAATGYLYRIRIKHPTKNTYVFNSHFLLLWLYPALVILVLLWSLYQGGEYLYMSLAVTPQMKVIVVIAYELLHLLLLGLILFSRLVQERKILSAYGHTIRQIRKDISRSQELADEITRLNPE